MSPREQTVELEIELATPHFEDVAVEDPPPRRSYATAGEYDRDQFSDFDSGDRCAVIDLDGRLYFNGHTGVLLEQLDRTLGPAIDEPIGEKPTTQTRRSSARSLSTQLARKITELAPGDLNHVIFTRDGGGANEAALELARRYHEVRGDRSRYKLIARQIADHGTDFGGLPLENMPIERAMFQQTTSGVRLTHNTNQYHRPDSETPSETTKFLLSELESLLVREEPQSIAALIIEPLQNAGGSLRPPTPEYLWGVRRLCDEHGILLISDEVVTGFGRLGSWFGSTLYGFQPDMITFAEGIVSANVPLGGVVTRDVVADTMPHQPPDFSGHLLNSSEPSVYSAALKNIERLEREELVRSVASLSPYLENKLEEVAMSHVNIIGDLRGDGFHWSFELVTDHIGKRWQPVPISANEFVTCHLRPALVKIGLICGVAIDRGGNPLVNISPPLDMTHADIDQLASLLNQAFGIARETAHTQLNSIKSLTH